MEVEEPVALPQVDSLATADHVDGSSSHHDITTPSQVRNNFFFMHETRN